MTKVLLGAALGVATLAAGTADAFTTVNWATLTNSSAGVVGGTIGSVGVTYSGAYSFAQLNGVGTNYWQPDGYSLGVVTPVPTSDVIALDQGGIKTITFSKPVNNIFVAFNSWNGNTVTFNHPFTVVSQGGSYWGSGSFSPFGGNTGFFGSGEVVGVLEFAGTFTSLTFTDSSENWHGIQIGIGNAGVPEPAAWALMLGGIGLLGGALRRRRVAAAA